MKALIQKSPWSDSIALHFAERVGTKFSVMINATFRDQVPGELMPEAPIRMSLVEAQELVDQLYAAGVRPTAANGTVGQLDATKYHLEDMRTLVFKSGGSA